MILIADGGSTTTKWSLLSKNGVEINFETEGYHPFFVGSDFICKSLENNLPIEVRQKTQIIERIFFYSAGGGYSTEADGILIDGLSSVFNSAKITIETDLVAAARSLLGDTKGFAAILGTGTNTCLYDGKEVTSNIESLGFLLGDEGSGSYIGKKLIGDYIRGAMPFSVKKAFYEAFKLNEIELLNKVYEHPVPNQYCASFAKFIGTHLKQESYFYDLVYSAFHDFFKNIVIRYPNYNEYSFNCAGSIGFYFGNVLGDVATEFGMKMGNIEKDPMAGLVAYHIKKLSMD